MTQQVGQQIVDQARLYLRTPFQHEGRHRKYGLDCVGLLIVVADDLGLPNKGPAYRYKLSATEGTLRKALVENGLRPLPEGTVPIPGDVLTFWFEKRDVEYHVAIYANDVGYPTMIHTSGVAARRNGRAHPLTLGAVTEHGFSDYWRKRQMRVYRLSQLAEVA